MTVSPGIEGTSIPARLLFLSATTNDQSALAVDREYNRVKSALQTLGVWKDWRRAVEHMPATGWDQVPEQLLSHRPSIVHFAGHGHADGSLEFSTREGRHQRIKPEGLAKLLEHHAKDVKLVVLNACYSDALATELIRHIDIVIGMTHAISDEAAILFAPIFYQQLAGGKSVQTAFDVASAIVLGADFASQHSRDIAASASNEPAARLRTRDGVTASLVTFTTGPDVASTVTASIVTANDVTEHVSYPAIAMPSKMDARKLRERFVRILSIVTVLAIVAVGVRWGLVRGQQAKNIGSGDIGTAAVRDATEPPDAPEPAPDAISRTAICGNGVVEPGEQCDDGNRVNDDRCSNRCRYHVIIPLAPPHKDPAGPSDNPPSPGANHYAIPAKPWDPETPIERTDITPSPSMKHMILRKGAIRKAHIVLTICARTTGLVDSVTIVTPSGDIEYDSFITLQLLKWKYAPYVVDGLPQRICGKLVIDDDLQ